MQNDECTVDDHQVMSSNREALPNALWRSRDPVTTVQKIITVIAS